MKNIHGYPDHDKEIVLKHIDRDKEREKKLLNKYFITHPKLRHFSRFFITHFRKADSDMILQTRQRGQRE